MAKYGAEYLVSVSVRAAVCDRGSYILGPWFDRIVELSWPAPIQPRAAFRFVSRRGFPMEP